MRGEEERVSALFLVKLPQNRDDSVAVTLIRGR
jgi:hypothetical protein